MTVSLECPECKQIAKYDPEEILGEAIKVYKGSTVQPELPNFIVVQCKMCPKTFKVPKRNLLKSKALNRLIGE